MSVNALAVLLAALVGGLWGWRVGTRRTHRKPVMKDPGQGGTPDRRRRLAMQRYLTAGFYAVLGAAGTLLVIAIARR